MARGVKFIKQDKMGRLRKAIYRGTGKSLDRAGAYLRGVVMKSIATRKTAAPPGHQPHTRKGQLRRAMWFDTDYKRMNVVVGPRASWITTIGSTHEFGKTENDTKQQIENNWKITVGGHGPLRGRLLSMYGIKYGKRGRRMSANFADLGFAKLDTPAQVRRAKDFVESCQSGNVALTVGSGGKVYRVTRGARQYPERPFMAKGLEVLKERIPNFWLSSIRD